MGLGIYSSPTPTTKASQGTFTAPLVIAADGRQGAVTQKRLYVRNDDTTYMYSGVSVRPVDLTGISVVDGTGGFNVKVSPGDTQPTESGWQRIAPAVPALLSGVVLGSGGDTATYAPFWVRVEVPRSISVRNITDVRLRLSATKIAR